LSPSNYINCFIAELLWLGILVELYVSNFHSASQCGPISVHIHIYEAHAFCKPELMLWASIYADLKASKVAPPVERAHIPMISFSLIFPLV
jgi:hypothetical protein